MVVGMYAKTLTLVNDSTATWNDDRCTMQHHAYHHFAPSSVALGSRARHESPQADRTSESDADECFTVNIAVRLNHRQHK